MQKSKQGMRLSSLSVPFFILLSITMIFLFLTIGKLRSPKAATIRISELDQYDLSEQYVGLSNASMDQYPANRIELTCDGCPDVLANQEMLLQVLINLTINANKHTKEDVIVIQAMPAADGWVRMQVEDHGSGISPEDRPHIFDRGFSRDGSSGLGLAICKDVVEAHGGRIDVSSNSERGIIIGFTIPRYESARAQTIQRSL